jgi:hypothetical protein
MKNGAITPDEINAGLAIKIVGRGKHVNGQFHFDQPVPAGELLETDHIIIMDGNNGKFLARALRPSGTN